MRLKFINGNFITLFIKLDPLNKPFSKFAVFLFFIFLSKWGQVFSQVSFTTSPASINNTLTLCSGSQILFTNTTAGNVNTINWTFPGGNPGNANTNGPHIVTFSTPGTYVISLSVNGGVASTMQVVIQASSTSSNLNLLLDNACVSGSGFGSSTFNDVTYFTSCANSFQGDNICLYTTTTLTNNNSIHNIFWGDGTSNLYTGSNIPSNQLAFQHYYQNTGASFITYTLQESNNSCVRSKIYPLYTGANPTAVISTGGVPTLCNPGSVNYNIIPGTQNTIGTIYTISVNDAGGGSNTSYTFNHPPPASLNHLFNSVSCGTTSVINSNTYQNSFQVSISSSNACGSSSSAIGPINIQSAPDAIVSTTPSLATYNNKVCQFSNVTFNDISTPGTNINVQGNANSNPPIPPYSCNNIYKKIWRLYGPLGLITMSNAYATILSGSLGTSQILSSANSWVSGSTNVDVQFLLPGNYKMTLYVGAQNNPCGIDSTVTNICVTPDFQVNITSPFVTACAPAIGIFQNNSTPAQCNLNNVSAWTVTPSNPQNCGQPAWSYNNNTNAQSLNASVAFTGPGVYTVQLQNSLNSPVFSNTTPLGCQPKTTTAQITIKAPPVITLPPTFSFCEDASFNPSATVNNCYGIDALTFAWNFNPNNNIPFNSQPNPLLSANPNPGIIYPQVGGPFPFTVSVTNECGTTIENSTITITAEASASISYVGSPFCTSITTPQAVTQAGTTGGSYSSSTDLNINASTGAITPSLSIPGIYTVTYTVAASGGCAAVSTTASVTITAAPTAIISYAGPFCKSETVLQNVTLNGTGAYTGGTFSATPSGLTIVSSGTNAGAITPNTSSAGTYTVTYTIPASGGCAAVPVTTTVTITPTPVTPIISYSGPYCTSENAPQAVTQTGAIGGTYSASPSGLSINASTGAITPSLSIPGIYTVTYTVAASGGCAAVSTTASVTITAAPTAIISYAGPFCKSETVLQNVTLNGTGAYTGGTFSATPSGLTIVSSGTNAGAITPNTSSAGTYTVTYTIPASGGCAAVPVTTTVTITPTPVTPIISYSGPYCTSENAPQAVTQTGAIGGTYSASPSGLSINAITGAITPSASTAGTYTVTYTVAAAGGCAVVSATTTITINAVPSFLNTSISICSDLPIGFTFTSNPTPGVSSWNIVDTIMQSGLIPSNTNFQMAPNGSTTTANLSAIANDVYTNTSGTNKTVTYKVVPTGSNGCLGDTFNIFVTILPEPVVSDTLYQNICSNTILNSVFPPSFPVISPVWYYVNNLTFIGTVTIAGGQPITSNGAQIVANAYPNTASQDDIFLNTGSSTATVVYNVTPISTFGCVGSNFYMSVEIIPSNVAMLNEDTIIRCSGECINLNLMSNSSLSPIWHYIPSNNNLQTPSQSVQFSPTISDCLINTGNDIEQIEYEVQFIVGSDPNAGCPSSPDTITVFVNPLPTINPSADLNLCLDFATNPILFTGNVTGSVYNWTATNLNVGLPSLTGVNSIPSFLTTNSGLSPISTIVEVTPVFINNNVQCEGPIDQFTITINPVPSVFPVNEIILCEGELSSSVILLGTLGGTIFNWVNSNVSVGLASPGAGNIPVFTAQNPTLLPIQSTVTVTPLFGLAQCPGGAISFDITVKPAPTIIPQNASICSGDTLDINLSANLASTFQWFATPNLNVLNETYTPTQNTDIINDLLVQTTTIPQTVQYNVSAISTQYNCESSPTIFNVIVNPLPVPSFTILNPPFCDLSPISFQNNTTGILDFTWSFDDGIYSNLYSPSHQFPTFGAYDVQLNAINPQTGCVDSIVNQIIISPTPSAVFSYSDSLGCDVLDVTYTAVSSNPTWDYFWDFGNGETLQQASSVGYQFDLEGCYDVSLTVTNNNGCTATQLYTDIACVYDSPIASFSTDQYVLNEIDPLVSFYNNSINANSFEWEFGDGTNSFAENPTHSYPEDAASYLVTLVAYNEISCTDSATITIVILKDVGLYVPNSFTPDGDEYNHTFYPVLTEGFKKDSYHMSIFDRWGELVFESYDPSFGWNGTYGKNGIQCQIGTYTWVIEVIELQSAVNRKYSGHLNLIR